MNEIVITLREFEVIFIDFAFLYLSVAGGESQVIVTINLPDDVDQMALSWILQPAIASRRHEPGIETNAWVEIQMKGITIWCIAMPIQER